MKEKLLMERIYLIMALNLRVSQYFNIRASPPSDAKDQALKNVVEEIKILN